MSLRFRVVLAIVLVLLTGSALGLAVVGWQARATLRAEMTAALASGRQAAARSLAAAAEPQGAVEVVHGFDGDRHLAASLESSRGVLLATSRAPARSAAPGWFAALFDLRQRPATLLAPGGAGFVLRLEPDATSDVGAIWTELGDLALVLLASIGVTAALAWLTVGHALSPLGDVAEALVRIGVGRYDTRLEARGAREVARLAEGVNEMVARLAAMQARTAALERQLLDLQDEERADLARDLHDEMGPHLFAVSLDAAMARRHIEQDEPAEALAQVVSIQSAVARMQRLVREILGRLRPTELTELGLAGAVEDLVAFWRARHPEISFEVALDLDESVLAEEAREALYRVAQEGLANAIRHGRPRVVQVRLRRQGEAIEAFVSDDGAGAAGAGPEGFGLSGMRQRLAGIGGDLRVERGAPGWTLIARAPCSLAGEMSLGDA